jgi:predicted metal-binding membrane protein
MSETGPVTRPGLNQTIPVAVVIMGVAAAAWVALAAGAGHTTHDEVLGSGHAPDPAAIAALLGGWQLMVAAMMLPPEIASPSRSAADSGRRWWAQAGVVVATTCAVWTGFGIVALAGDAVVHLVVGSWPRLAGLVAPAVLVGAGAFQLSALRRQLLAGARRPSGLPWRRALCGLGSCWALMLVAFALAVGDVVAMAALTVVMTVERAMSPRLEPLTGHMVGWALIGAGALVAIQPGMIG